MTAGFHHMGLDTETMKKKKKKKEEGKDTVKPYAIKEPFGADRGLEFFYFRRYPEGECEGGARGHLCVA